MPSRNPAAQCSTRRKHSLGKLRRAHPASGATWNVQVVRGKMTSKCLWHACRALILGLILMLLGAGMATIGYYADQLSIGSEIRGNSTIRVKNETKGFHLNNLSYVGPIVMGFGGFIVVASCVMTFEARDSAAKVVPARLKANSNSNKTNMRSNPSSAASQRRANGVIHQSNRWDHHLGVFRSSPAEAPAASASAPAPFDRQALTAALVHFSKTIGNSHRLSPKLHRLSYSGSVPNLTTHSPHYATPANLAHLLSPNRRPPHLVQNAYSRRHRHHHAHTHQSSSGRHLKSRGTRISSSLVQRTTRDSKSSLLLAIPPHKHYWHALSVDESGRVESQARRIIERTKRSETAKRHVLARQKPIENEEDKREESLAQGKRRSSTISDSSYSGRWTYRCTSIASRTPSIDSRKVQVDLHSPDTHRPILRSPKRYNSAQSSTPSVEREFRSQLSVCSEPVTGRQLSGQSSLEPCVPEESPENDEKYQIPTEEIVVTVADCVKPSTSIATSDTPPLNGILKKSRPDSLQLNAPRERINKFLYRSNSSLTLNRPIPKIAKDEREAIFFIKSKETATLSSCDRLQDSLLVINEKRKSLRKTESETALMEKKCFTYSGIDQMDSKEDEHQTNDSTL